MAPIWEFNDEESEALRILGIGKRRTDLEGSLTESAPSIIIQPDNYWTIENVVNPRTGEKRNRLLLKEMLPPMDYFQMTAHYIQAIANGEFHAEDMPTNLVVIEAVKDSNHPDKEAIRQFYQKSMKATFPQTLTQAVYGKQEKFVHKKGIPGEEYEMRGRIWGPDRIIDAKRDAKMLNALVRTNNVEKVRAVLNWVNETPVYVWRKNEKSISGDKRVARFGAGSYGVGFSLSGDPAYQYSSFGYK